jgi:glycosyltransferase involved in cell wall biosynthesis
MIDLSSFPDPKESKVGWPWCIPPHLIGREHHEVRNLPKISIVTPSFNQGQFIEETIRSVLLQGYPNMEYIIIDGGSTDDTVNVIKKYQKYLKYWVSEKDNGQSHAINKGAEYCTGEIFNWLNSDDLLAEGALLFIGESFDSHAFDIFIGGCITFRNDIELMNNSLFPKRTLDANIFAGGGCVFQPAVFWNLKILRRYFPLVESFHYIMDIDLRTRYFLENALERTYLAGMVTCFYRLHAASKTTSDGPRFQSESLQYAVLLAKHYNLERLRKLILTYAVERFGVAPKNSEVIPINHHHSSINPELVILFFLNSSMSRPPKSIVGYYRNKLFLRNIMAIKNLRELVNEHFHGWHLAGSLDKVLIEKVKTLIKALNFL